MPSNIKTKNIGALGVVLAIVLMSCGGSSSSSNAGRSKNVAIDSTGKCNPDAKDIAALDDTNKALGDQWNIDMNAAPYPGTQNQDALKDSTLTGDDLTKAQTDAKEADKQYYVEFLNSKKSIADKYDSDLKKATSDWQAGISTACTALLATANNTTNADSPLSKLNAAISAAVTAYNAATNLNEAMAAYNTAAVAAANAYKTATGLDPNPYPVLKQAVTNSIAIGSEAGTSTGSVDTDVTFSVTWQGNIATVDLLVPKDLTASDYALSYSDAKCDGNSAENYFSRQRLIIDFSKCTSVKVFAGKGGTDVWGAKLIEKPAATVITTANDPTGVVTFETTDGVTRALFTWSVPNGNKTYFTRNDQEGYEFSTLNSNDNQGSMYSNAIKPGCNSGEFQIVDGTNGPTLLSSAYSVPAIGTTNCDATSGGVNGLKADPTLSKVSYNRLTASVSLVIPEGGSSTGWSITTSGITRGNFFDTGAGSRLQAGDTYAAVTFRPNSNGSATDHEVSEFQLVHNGEVVERISISFDEAIALLNEQLANQVIVNGPYDQGSTVVFYVYSGSHGIIGNRFTVGIKNSTCARATCDMQVLDTSYTMKLKQGDKGTFVVLDGSTEVFSKDFAYSPITDQYPYKLSVNQNTDNKSLEIKLKYGSLESTNVYLREIDMWGGSILVTGGGDCITTMTYTMICTGMSGSGQVILSITPNGETDAFILDQFDYQFGAVSAPGAAAGTGSTGGTTPGGAVDTGSTVASSSMVASGGTSSGVVDIAALPFVEGVVVAQVLDTNQTEISCDAGCIDSLLANTNITGEIFVSVDGEAMQKLDATTVIKVDKSSSMKIEIRPTDGSKILTSEIEFIERLESDTAGSTATQTMNTTTPKTWVIFILGLSVLILIGYAPVIRARSKK